MSKQLTEAFNKFKGKTVMHPLAMGICQVTKEIGDVAKSQGLSLRLIYPNQPITADFCDTRLNVQIEVGKDHQYRIKSFDLG